MLSYLAGFLKGPVDRYGSLFLAGFIHAAVQNAPQFEIGRTEKGFAALVFSGLLGPRNIGAVLLSEAVQIILRHFIEIALAAEIDGESARILLLGEAGAEGLFALFIHHALDAQHGIGIPVLFFINPQKRTWQPS